MKYLFKREFSSTCATYNGSLAIWLLVLISGVCGLPKVFRTNEICGVYNGHRVYLELGDRGQLQATNVTYTKQTNQTQPSVCTLELVTCPSCNFKISLSYSNFPSKCAINNDLPCRCDYLEFSEPPFDTEQSGRRNCGHDVVYQTQTRSVMIKFLYWTNHSHAFTLEYVAERNRETLQANPGGLHNLTGAHTKVIATPYFPSYYPRDFGKEYVLSCNVEACRINVIFSDFQLAKTSSMEFYDWNGQRLGAVSGASFRPPVVQSTGPSMIIRFFANGGSGLGYRAKVSFLTLDSAAVPSMIPDTNCGGMVENIGGAITMMNMVPAANESRIFDCIWILKPPNTYAHLKTHLSLKIDTFDKMDPNSMLTIVQGVTSDNPILDVLRPNAANYMKNYIAPLTTGLYVHLRGTFAKQSRMALIYSAFSYLDCFMGSEFLCHNRKCIPIQLHCDGFDHCGDGSDEPETCEVQWQADRIDRRWYAHTPNYYFPKMDRYPDLQTATIIFIASSVGLVMLISALIILLYRTGNRARAQRELQSQLQTISELLDNNNTRGNEDVDEPPVYEAPPDYDEIIKVGMDEDIRRKRRRHSSSASGRRSRLRRSRRQSNASESHNPILEVRLPPEANDEPSTSNMLQLPYERYDHQQYDNDDEDDEQQNTQWSQQEPNFFNTARMIENTTASTQNPGHTAAATTSNGNSSSSPPPTYDASQLIFNGSQQAQNPSRSNFNQNATNVSISLNDSSVPSIDQLVANNPTQMNSTGVSSSQAPAPQHIWSESIRVHRPWLAFNSDEIQSSAGPVASVESVQNRPVQQSFSAADLNQIHEIDAYFLAYGSATNGELGSPTPPTSTSGDMSSNSTSRSQLPSSASFARNSCYCSSISSNARSTVSNSYDYIVQSCPRCRESQRSQAGASSCHGCLPNRSTQQQQPAAASVCSTCGGKISLQQEYPGNSGDNSTRVEGTVVPQPSASNTNASMKICNCFPKFPTHNSFVRAGSANVISTTRPLSVDLIETGVVRRSVANLTSNFEAFFNSHLGIPGSDVRT